MDAAQVEPRAGRRSHEASLHCVARATAQDEAGRLHVRAQGGHRVGVMARGTRCHRDCHIEANTSARSPAATLPSRGAGFMSLSRGSESSVFTRLGSWPRPTRASLTASTNGVGPQT